MTTNLHTPIATGAAANASVINTPLGALDAVISGTTNTLASLTTSDKDSIIEAINSLVTDKETHDNTLTALAGVASATDTVPYFTGADAAGVTGLTSAGRALIDDVDVAAMRTTLGLGDSAVLDVGTGAGDVAAGIHAHVASTITNTPAGGVAATDVQAAINELDTDKAAASHTHVKASVTDITDLKLTDLTVAADVTTHNATSARPGLMAKLQGAAGYVLDGLGAWVLQASNIKVNMGGVVAARRYLHITGAFGVVTHLDDVANDAVRITIAGGSGTGGVTTLDELTDVTLGATALASKDVLYYDGAEWINKAQSAIKLDDFGTPDDNTDLDASTTYHGLLPKRSGNSSDVLRGDGTWGVASSVGHTIQEEGSNLSNRPTLNFVGSSVTAADDSVNNRTNVTITGTRTAFTHANLTAGILTVTHNFGISAPYSLLVTITDNSNQIIIPSSITYLTNTFTVDLLFADDGPGITGNWGVYYI